MADVPRDIPPTLQATPYDERDTPVAAEIHEGYVRVTLADGRIISNPVAWYDWLTNAPPEKLRHVEFWTAAVYWPDLDEGLLVEVMLHGIRAIDRHQTPSA